MVRQKMFDSAFQRAFTEAIDRENKTLEKWHLGGISGPPHTAKVNWDDDDLSAEDDDEEACDSCGKPLSAEDDQEEKQKETSEPKKGKTSNGMRKKT
ncbi:uncharacterized protein TNIN_84221 [Trichonephila inaurata madagascariensis]|uniref:Uncharacterized protein n=1 Tax=Trichonephila inaurata madagascariensis TaxID=2747483 RepID=A0A8X6XEL6_9ARAC|nr:uncharacterized protein TNIN_84221 [Trichonephila inaurata madagascariensis]